MCCLLKYIFNSASAYSLSFDLPFQMIIIKSKVQILTRLTVVIILQYMQILNHTVLLKLMSIIPQFFKNLEILNKIQNHWFKILKIKQFKTKINGKKCVKSMKYQMDTQKGNININKKADSLHGK